MLRVCPLLLLLWSGSAFALGPGEASLSGGVGPAVSLAERTQAGVQVGGRLVRGISDAWAGRLGVQSAWYPAGGTAPSTHSLHVTTQAIGVTWALDALNVVPFADFGLLTADVRGGGTGASWHLGGELGGGIDYLVNRHLVTSLIAHVDYLPFHLAGGHRERPLQATLALLVGRAF
jgi:hypothetical protein